MTASTPADCELGRPSTYPERHDPSRLFPIPRAKARADLPLAGVPLHGVDLWNAWELSWLDPRGVPRVGIAEIRVPADSPRLIESKSLKLYLNGFNQEPLPDAEAAADRIATDLSRAAGAAVLVRIRPLEQAPGVGELEGDCIDAVETVLDHYGPPQASALRILPEPAEETLVSHLFKSNCPVTGQPDWASVQIRYRGPRLDRASLLRYLVGFRRHTGFHEHCVERIFADLWHTLQPERLSVYARFTRRGGIDINPFRSSVPGEAPANPRLARQ